MKKMLVVFAFCFAVFNAEGAVDWNINSSQLIENGSYGNIRIFDGQSEQTIVEMSGGSCLSVITHDTSKFDLHSGSADVITVYDSSAVNLFGGAVESVYVNTGILNLYGYDLSIQNHDVSNGIFNLTGYWENGAAFEIYFERAYLDQNTFLHEVPEPATVLFFGLAGGVLYNRRKA
ncbi:PEP-CTERM sorting domain-containing protein [Sedimentisphaera salicampi]|uniref:PEP-CTERM protein-sorting domain-containing protein n=1 Tax=Sedimentisphaera salicampi TaxID=1941349 RepID=A0A1W6LIT1_9BACT|nr:PEP-CTERM sorting domain-containing protein [Sedimentisphaera salicampi]ARN55700.1 hypothetical protein STSP1_00063 [Sedimentisphaera salicampi]